MAFSFQSPVIGAPNITDVTSIAPGIANLPSLNLEPQLAEVRQGWDVALGSGEFIYLRYSGTIGIGAVVEITPTLVAGVVTLSATAWAGTANTGRPLAVTVVAGTVGQYGWFQIQGNAIVATSGTPAAGNPAYFQAAGVVSPTGVAGKQIQGAQFATAVSQTIGSGTTAVVLTSTQSILTIMYPSAQDAIT